MFRIQSLELGLWSKFGNMMLSFAYMKLYIIMQNIVSSNSLRFAAIIIFIDYSNDFLGQRLKIAELARPQFNFIIFLELGLVVA